MGIIQMMSTKAAQDALRARKCPKCHAPVSAAKPHEPAICPKCGAQVPVRKKR